jgi:hypothetical protein
MASASSRHLAETSRQAFHFGLWFRPTSTLHAGKRRVLFVKQCLEWFGMSRAVLAVPERKAE